MKASSIDILQREIKQELATAKSRAVGGRRVAGVLEEGQ
jgi:hypothetical protein